MGAYLFDVVMPNPYTPEEIVDILSAVKNRETWVSLSGDSIYVSQAMLATIIEQQREAIAGHEAHIALLNASLHKIEIEIEQLRREREEIRQRETDSVIALTREIERLRNDLNHTAYCMDRNAAARGERASSEYHSSCWIASRISVTGGSSP